MSRSAIAVSMRGFLAVHRRRPVSSGGPVSGTTSGRASAAARLPLAAATYLDRGKLTGADESVGLGRRDVEDLGDLGELEEALRGHAGVCPRLDVAVVEPGERRPVSLGHVSDFFTGALL